MVCEEECRDRNGEKSREIEQNCHLFPVRGDCKCASIKIIQSKDAVYIACQHFKCNIFVVKY